MLSLLQAINADPADPGPKLALADEIEAEGGDRPLIVGLRWCAEYGRWPRAFAPEHPIMWLWADPDRAPSDSSLPRRIDSWIMGRYPKRGWRAHDALTLVRRLGEAIIEMGLL